VAQKILIVPLATVPVEEAEAQVRASVPADAELLVIAPVSDLSPLRWLTNDEDGARDEARAKAERVAEAAPPARAEAVVGDSDPVQAIEDALRTFRADEIVVVAPPEDETNWLESDAADAARQRFGAPVTRLTAAGRDTRP
jgi:hypothetical protein